MPVSESELFALRQRTVTLEQQVARLERTVDFLLKELKLEYVDTPDYADDTPYIDLLRQNKKLDAVKLYRANTGAGLTEAVQYIEALKF
jgi:ribosomal protein L7/L12